VIFQLTYRSSCSWFWHSRNARLA